MDFEDDEAAITLAEVVTAVTEKLDPSVIRAAWRGDHDPARQAWAALAGTGLTGLMIPEQQGGLGLDECAMPLAFEAIGRSGLPVPAVETVLVAAPVLAQTHSELLTGVLTGNLLATVSTETSLVPHAAVSDLVVRLDPSRTSIARLNDLKLEPVLAVDRARDIVRGPGSVNWSDVDVDRAHVARLKAGAVVATSAVLVGLATRLLDLTNAYVTEREQFGVKVGSFQAVKHHLANAYFAIESARPSVQAAAWYLARDGVDAQRWVSMAKAVSSDAAYLTCRLTLQAHGAIAYTTEYDHHLFAKRVWALMDAWGNAAQHRRIIRQALSLGNP